MKRRELALAATAVLLIGGGAFGAVVELHGPTRLVLDDDPASWQLFEFEVVVASAGLAEADSFFYSLAVSGDGVAFEFVRCEGRTAEIAADPARSPRYVFCGVSSGFWADQDVAGDPATLYASDLAAGPDPAGPIAGGSLGIVLVMITDEEAALGWHTLSSSDGAFYWSGGREDLTVQAFDFEVVPEPASAALLAAGALAALIRRRRPAC